MKTKYCNQCETEKPVGMFWKNRTRKDGLQTVCKTCHYEKYNVKRNGTERARRLVKKYDASEHGKKKNRDRHYRNLYGITLQDYEKMFEEQKGRCFICGKHQPEKMLSVDHCHETGEVRRLLCVYCNNCYSWFERYKSIILSYPQHA